jgi:hypothetical protein
MKSRMGSEEKTGCYMAQDRVVKVVPLVDSPRKSLGGYMTVGSTLLGKTPRQIEQALGLKRDYFANGARIYRFTRAPMAHEYEYEFTALCPDGLPDYPPGSPVIHQWRIKYGVQIPVDPLNYLDLRSN